MKIFVSSWIKDFIEKSPQVSRKNACGWLIGFPSSTDQIIAISAIIASKYVDTDDNYRLPDPNELEEILRIIPGGLQIIGMFHFKPGAKLKITNQAGIPERFYNNYADKIICITNIESTKWFQISNLEYTELEVHYHELPDDLLKSLIVFINISLATEINLKLDYLPQILRDIIVEVNKGLKNSNTRLRRDSRLIELSNRVKPYLTREDIDSMLNPKTILKDYESLQMCVETDFSSIKNPEIFLSVDFSLNLLSNEEEIKKRDKFTKRLGAYGVFSIPCIIVMNLQHPQSTEEILSLLETTLRDQLSYLIPHSMIKYSHNRQGLLILPPESHIMQYEGVILNLNAHLKKIDIIKKQFDLELVENLLHLSYFSQNTLPDIEDCFLREEDRLLTYRQKFSTMAKLVDKVRGIGLLRGLGYIYRERGQIQGIKEVQRLASSL
ncbi:MAG: hypothetical protein JW776_16270 [Candidatus Lokiarchaeota archaeon]|nr:hypothetical protein [Candidatus Lokiarchaeota archaeon]